MPVHDLGYRAWSGARTPRLLRPLFVAQSGIALVWRRKLLRFMLMVSWLPVVFPAFGIFAFEYSSTAPGMQDSIISLLAGPLDQRELAMRVASDPEAARHDVWSTLILAFFRYPQLTVMVMLVGLIAPMLVCYDLRSKAYLLYFSRPLTSGEYILGKSAVVWFFLSAIVTVPALALYGMGILLSSDLSVVSQTWDIVPRILAASVALAVPTTALAMSFSACTSESRYAMFAWFATWILGFVAYQVFTFWGAADRGRPRGREFRRGPPNWEEMGIDFDKWRWLSPYHTMGKIQGWIFDLDIGSSSVVPALSMMVVVTVVGTLLVRNRIHARLSV